MKESLAKFEEVRREFERKIVASVALPESVLRRSGEPSLMPPIAPAADYVSLSDARRRALECFAYAWANPLAAARAIQREQEEYDAARVAS
jgi:hypothetical protein